MLTAYLPRRVSLFSLFILGMLFCALTENVHAGELVYQFKNPSFSGIGTSSHWLTMENQEFSRKQAIQDKIEAALKAKALEEKNSILNRFVNNLQSRIYSQISQQLTQNLFSSKGSSGSFVLDDNSIEYTNTGDTIVLNITDSSGNVTNITIPIGGFSF